MNHRKGGKGEVDLFLISLYRRRRLGVNELVGAMRDATEPRVVDPIEGRGTAEEVSGDTTPYLASSKKSEESPKVLLS